MLQFYFFFLRASQHCFATEHIRFETNETKQNIRVFIYYIFSVTRIDR